MAKVSIIGAGVVGSQLAFLLAEKKLADIVLIDIVEGFAEGKALDVFHSLPLLGSDIKIVGGSDFSLLKDSDIVVLTAGFPRKEGMSRDDLIKINSDIVSSVVPEIVKYSPNSVLIVVTNPLSAMVYLAYKLSGFSKKKVLGMAGVLDSSRFRSFVAEEAGVSFDEVSAFVCGDHGDLMVPLISLCKIKGKTLSDFISKDNIAEIVKRTKNSGGEIVSLLKNSSAGFAPAVSILEMIDSIVNDKKKVLSCSVLLEGEYGISDLFVGVPVKLGKNGVEEIVVMNFSDTEKKEFQDSVEHIRDSIKKI
jgi:malate dehydrogenase